MKKERKYYYRTDYGNESVDITKECCNYLLEQDFYKNEEKVNIELLEKALIEYSINKMIKWKVKISEEKLLSCLQDLPSILKVLNNHIPTQKERESFFAQYTHCIIYIYSRIKNNEPIKWTHMDNNVFPRPYTYLMEQGEIIELITKGSATSYKIPLNLMKTIKENYPQKKNPVLKK